MKKRLVLYLVIMSFSIILFGIGFAQISNIDLRIDGDASLPGQTGIVISDIHYSSCNDMTKDNVTINTYYQSMFTSHVELGNASSSFITLEVTVKNLTNDSYIFDGLVYDSNFYTNNNIVPSLTNITENSSILNPNGGSGDEITFYITFSYLDPNNITNQTLNSTINFHFTPTVKINYSGLTNASGNTEEYIRRNSFTNSNNTTYTPTIDLGSFSGSFEIKDSSGSTLQLGTHYSYSNGIVTFLQNLTADYYTVSAKQSNLADVISDIIDGEEPDDQGIYTGTPGDNCTNTFVLDGTSDNNLRYVGSNPCNYIKFNCDDTGNNCETWRIIGIMNDTSTKTIKIISQTRGAGTLWNSTGTNNTWEGSLLQTTLNTTYYNNLHDNYGKNLIQPVKWPVGDINVQRYFGNTFYALEHSEFTVNNANVGLLTLSDYALATSGLAGNGGWNRTNCLTKRETNNNWNNCSSNDWLWVSGSSNEWTSITRQNTTNDVFIINNTGRTAVNSYSYASYTYRPVVYLKTNVQIAGGDGSQNNPYTLEGMSS